MRRFAPHPPIATSPAAAHRPAATIDVAQPTQVRNARVLSLVLVLEALRQMPDAPNPPKG